MPKWLWKKLQGDTGFVLGDPVMIEQEAWFQLGDAARTRLGEALAIDAVCRAETPMAEHEVEIRSDMGVVLMRRAFDLTRTDITSTRSGK